MEAGPQSNVPSNCGPRLGDTEVGAIASPRRLVRRRDPSVCYWYLPPPADRSTALARTMDRRGAAAGRHASAPGTNLSGRVVPAPGDEPAEGSVRRVALRDPPRTC